MCMHAIFLSQSGGSLPLVLVASSITFIAFYRFCYDQFSRTTAVSLDVYGRFERVFRRVAGRRNIYNIYILIGVLLGTPLYSLIGILFHSALTAVAYASRAAIHMHTIDKKDQSNMLETTTLEDRLSSIRIEPFSSSSTAKELAE